MKLYQTDILTKLIKKYEHSKLSKEGTKNNRSIFIKFDLKEMKDYVSEDSYKYEQQIEEAVKELEEKKYITILEKKGRIQKVILNVEMLDLIYQELQLKSPQNKNNQYLSMIEKYQNHGVLVNRFCEKIRTRIEHFQSIKSYFSSEEELKEILIVLEYLEKQNTEISERNFSAKYLHDSKKLEHMKTKILGIIKECMKEYDEYDYTLEFYNVYKNPTQVYLRGHGKFKIGKQIIDLDQMCHELILSSNQLKQLSVIALPVDRIVTVENFTTFYDIPYDHSCIIYLGGFHNRTRKELLCKMYQFNSHLLFFHCGDIDVGGFYILNHLIQDTKIPFQSYYMDIETLNKYKLYCKKLTKEDCKRLEKLKGHLNLSNYFPIFDYMLKYNIKLEQENIRYDD